MSFPRVYSALKEMVHNIVLETRVARTIVRRSGFRVGAGAAVDAIGVPAGGEKGYALVKKSNEDFDAEWQPHGPYTYDWNAYEDQWWTYRGRPPQEQSGAIQWWYKDNPPGYAVEPVPIVDQTFSHINRPLSSGVDNDASLVFQFDRWAALRQIEDIDTVVWTWVDRRTGPTTSPTFKTNPTYSWDGDPTKMRSSWPSGPGTGAAAPTGGGGANWSMSGRSLGLASAPTAMRLQAYVTDCSDDAWWEIAATRWFADHDPRAVAEGNAHLKRLPLSGPGYFDSGWLEFVDYDVDRATMSNANIGVRTNVRFTDFEQPSFAIPFLEVQLRGYEFTDSFDFLYPRGTLPE